jgi:cobalt-zinc-cadmium efflux system protein
MEGCGGVLAVHDLHIWTISSGMYALSAHVVVHGDDIGRNDEILSTIKAGLRRTFGIDHTTIQIESVAYAHVDDVHTH